MSAGKAAKKAPAKKDSDSEEEEDVEMKNGNGAEEEEEANDDNAILEVFVGNLPFSATEQSVSALFEEFGTVTNVKMPLRDDGKPKGFAFVAFTTGKQAQKASEASLELDGRPLRINIGKGGQDNGRQGGR